MRTVWTFQLDNQVHTVTLERGWFNGSRRLLLDSVEIERVPPRLFLDLDPGSKHLFMIGEHKCAVIDHHSVGCDLLIDEVWVSTGRYKVANDILLCPANALPTGQETLLRPAETNMQTTGAEQLLRAGSEPPAKK